MNPLPQANRRAAPAAAINTVINSANAASSQKWAERPVEKLSATAAYYEEEEDPELACYLWDRKAQRPKNDHVRAAPKMQPAPVVTQQRVPPPPPQRQRVLLNQ